MQAPFWTQCFREVQYRQTSSFIPYFHPEDFFNFFLNSLNFKALYFLHFYFYQLSAQNWKKIACMIKLYSVLLSVKIFFARRTATLPTQAIAQNNFQSLPLHFSPSQAWRALEAPRRGEQLQLQGEQREHSWLPCSRTFQYQSASFTRAVSSRPQTNLIFILVFPCDTAKPLGLILSSQRMKKYLNNSWCMQSASSVKVPNSPVLGRLLSLCRPALAAPQDLALIPHCFNAQLTSNNSN